MSIGHHRSKLSIDGSTMHTTTVKDSLPRLLRTPFFCWLILDIDPLDPLANGG